MNAVKTNEQLHELQCKLKCFCCIGKYVLLSLLRWMLKNVDIATDESLTDPCKVFPKVLKNFQAHYNLRKEIKSLDFNNNKDLITSSEDWTDIKPGIECDFFDTTLLCDFLINIPIFASNSKSYVPLKRDKIIHSVKIPCTSLKVCCGICLKCFLCFHCCTHKAIRKHVLKIKALRDGYSHLEPEVCQKIEANPSEKAALDFHRNIKDGTDAIKMLLTFLLGEGEINQENYDIKQLEIDLVRLKTKDIYWKNFAGSVNLEVPYLQYSCPVNVNYSLLKLGQNEISVLLERFEIYDSELYKSFRENFMRKVRKLLTNKLTASGRIVPFQIKLKEMDVYIEKSNYMKATLHIESRENIVPDCYGEMDSVESQNLRSELKEVCEDELNKILEDANITVSVDCRGCKFASIHIYYKIYNHKITLTNGLRNLIKDGFRKVISMPSVLKILKNHDLHFCTVNVSFEDSTQEFVVGFTVVSDDKTAVQLIEDDLVEIKEEVKREIQKDFTDIFMKKQKQKRITKADNFDSWKAEKRLQRIKVLEECYITYIASRNKLKHLLLTVSEYLLLLHDITISNQMIDTEWFYLPAIACDDRKAKLLTKILCRSKTIWNKNRVAFENLEKSLRMIGHKADLRTFKSIAKKMKNQRGDSRIFHNLNQIKSLTRAKNNLDLTSVKSSIVYKSGVLVIPYALFEILDGIKVNHIGDVRWIKCLEELADSIKTPAKDALKVAFKAWKVDLLNDFDDSDEIWIAQSASIDVSREPKRENDVTHVEKSVSATTFIQCNQLDRTEGKDLIERINQRKEAETRLKSVEAVEACYITYIASRNRIKNLLHDELRRNRMADVDWCNICASSFCERKTTAINSSEVKELLHKDRTIFDDLERSLAACDNNDLRRIIYELEGNFSIEHRYYILERVKEVLKDETMEYQKPVIYRFLSLFTFSVKPATNRLLSVVDIELSNSWQAGVFVVPHDFFTILNNTEVIRSGEILKIKHFLSVIRTPSMNEVKVAFEKLKYDLINV